MNKNGAFAAAFCLNMLAPAAQACQPPIHPPGYVEPTRTEEVMHAFKQADMVFVAEVVRVTEHPTGMAEGIVKPRQVFKGKPLAVPSLSWHTSIMNCGVVHPARVGERSIYFVTKRPGQERYYNMIVPLAPVGSPRSSYSPDSLLVVSLLEKMR